MSGLGGMYSPIGICDVGMSTSGILLYHIRMLALATLLLCNAKFVDKQMTLCSLQHMQLADGGWIGFGLRHQNLSPAGCEVYVAEECS